MRSSVWNTRYKCKFAAAVLAFTKQVILEKVNIARQ